MRLRIRLTLAYTTVLFAVMIVATLLYVRGAREDVKAELQSTQLVVGQLRAMGTDFHFVHEFGRSVPDLGSLRAARHLRVDFLDADGRLTASSRSENGEDSGAPRWFAAILSPPLAFDSMSRPIMVDGGKRGELVITPDPATEIAEKWQDAKELAAFSLLLFIAVNAVLYAVVTRALQPIDQVLAVLRAVEGGNLRARLPSFASPEFGRIGESFNRMADALEHGSEQNRRLTLRLMQAQEEERKRIARELHDELGQSLTGIQADAAAIRRNNDGNRLVRDSADAICAVAQQLLNSVRGMLHRLRPEALETFGLAAALQELIDGWRRRNPDIACTLRVEGDLEPRRDETAVTVYRSVQEALTNVVRHSNATRVDVTLRRIDDTNGGRLVLAVSDNGSGTTTPPCRLGFGLLGIRERVTALGGALVGPRDLSPGFGIEVDLPLGKAMA